MSQDWERGIDMLGLRKRHLCVRTGEEAFILGFILYPSYCKDNNHFHVGRGKVNNHFHVGRGKDNNHFHVGRGKDDNVKLKRYTPLPGN